MELRFGTPEDASLSPDRLRHVTKLCQSWVDDGTHPSLTVLIAHNGVIALNEAFGNLGPEPGDPALTVDSIFPIASITKPITATAAMMLVEDGRIGLTRPVQEYLPEIAGDGKAQMLVHHLLTHTSGLRDEDVVAYILNNWQDADVSPPADGTDPMVHKQRVLGGRAPLWKSPGEEMWYSNINYAILGEIVRRVAGSSLKSFARERIFEPLGMSDSSYFAPDQKSSRVVRRPDEWKTAVDAEQFRVLAAPAAAVHSTAKDLAVFGQAFLNGGIYGGNRILSRATVDEMTRNQIPGIETNVLGQHHDEASWGYGWGVPSGEVWATFATLPLGTFSHGGGTGAFLWVDPAHELVCVYLSVARPRIVDGVLTGIVWPADLFANAVYAAVE